MTFDKFLTHDETRNIIGLNNLLFNIAGSNWVSLGIIGTSGDKGGKIGIWAEKKKEKGKKEEEDAERVIKEQAANIKLEKERRDQDIKLNKLSLEQIEQKNDFIRQQEQQKNEAEQERLRNRMEAALAKKETEIRDEERQHEMDSLVEANRIKMEQMNVQVAALIKEGEDMKFTNPTEYNEVKSKCYQKYLDNIVTAIPDVTKTAVLSFAFVGETSAGKTSTINAQFGTKLETDPDANTLGTNEVFLEGDTANGFKVFDVFGTNDQETYHELNQLVEQKALHYIIFVMGTTFESNSSLYKQLKILNAKVIIMRNKTEDFSQKAIEQSTKRCSTIFGVDSPVFKQFHIVAHPKRQNENGCGDQIKDVRNYLVNLPTT